ncbi:MAG: TatD family hydrolase, partial [Proteobacteria bacterium]|nr:TatD family hydrolase [Pseudomonadota bacterium]
VFEQLKKHHYFKAVMHSYNGSLQQTKLIVNQGIYCGFGTAVVNPKAHKLHELVRFVPLDSIMLETDAPDQPIYHRHGKINRPVDLLQVYKTVAELKNVSVEQLITATKVNCQNLLGL